MKQGTDDWFAARLGKVTASRVADVIAKTKSGPSASRQAYAVQLALERITGQREEGFKSAAMQRGTELEAEARAMYETRFGVLVAEVGFVPHRIVEMSGASPDGLIGSDGLLEIKCPDSKQHLEYLQLATAPAKYRPQVQWQMACTGRPWCDFVSYDPRFPERLRLHVVRVEREDKYIAELEAEVEGFLGEVAEIVEQIEALNEPAPAINPGGQP